jgi:hypothetical protein
MRASLEEINTLVLSCTKTVLGAYEETLKACGANKAHGIDPSHLDALRVLYDIQVRTSQLLQSVPVAHPEPMEIDLADEPEEEPAPAPVPAAPTRIACTFCPSTFVTDDARMQHAKAVHFKCSQCDCVFGNPGGLTAHTVAVHLK